MDDAGLNESDHANCGVNKVFRCLNAVKIREMIMRMLASNVNTIYQTPIGRWSDEYT